MEPKKELHWKVQVYSPDGLLYVRRGWYRDTVGSMNLRQAPGTEKYKPKSRILSSCVCFSI